MNYANIMTTVLARKLDGPVVSALRRAIAEVKQHWSVIGWVTKNLLSRAPPCFEAYSTRDHRARPSAICNLMEWF
jgi:hypothetical protein